MHSCWRYLVFLVEYPGCGRLTRYIPAEPHDPEGQRLGGHFCNSMALQEVAGTTFSILKSECHRKADLT